MRHRQIGLGAGRIAQLRRQHVLGIDHEIGDDGLLHRVLCRRRNPEKIVGRGRQRSGNGEAGISCRHAGIEPGTKQCHLPARLGGDLGCQRLIARVTSHSAHQRRIGEIADRHQPRWIGFAVQAVPDVIDLENVFLHADIAGRNVGRNTLPVELQQITGQYRIPALDRLPFRKDAMPEERPVPAELHIVRQRKNRLERTGEPIPYLAHRVRECPETNRHIGHGPRWLVARAINDHDRHFGNKQHRLENGEEE